MKGQVYLISALLFTIIISVFSILNVGKVEVNYLFWRGQSPLIIVILVSVSLGCILTLAVGSMKFIKMKKENKQLITRLHAYEKENKLLDADE